VNGWNPHRLRHRAATDLRRAGSLDVAKVVLGHTSTKMTALYAEADILAAHQVIERIG
jgi:integrase